MVLTPPSLFASVGRPSVRLWFSFAIERISSPTIVENNKLFDITTVNLNASLFDRQLNYYSHKWPINSITRLSSLFWLQWKLQWELPKFLLGYWHKYFTMIKTEAHLLSTAHFLNSNIFKLNWNAFFVFSSTCKQTEFSNLITRASKFW